ncbi:fused signal transduction protein/response regulator [Campylobacterota bacterium]|nr:fused signal transduction protein/response regulator [Campylobacterota bacterium]GHV06220.1 fused signal transduction protein/response regulator [Campylobacterota bacterium]
MAGATSTKSSVLKTGSNEMELVDFRIFKQVGERVYEGIYGVNVAKVREIIKIPKLTELPGAPEYIEGIFDLRGVVIPVVNLAKWMRIIIPEKDRQKSRVVIAEFSKVLVGFIVSEAKRIRRINWEDIEPATFSGGTDEAGLDHSKVTGVTKIENDSVLLILDFESIVKDIGLYNPTVEVTTEIEHFTGSAMVIDDSATARKIVKTTLEKMGLRVYEAVDGSDALEKLNGLYQTFGENITNELRVIVSDVEMPRMDGFHFAAHVKDDPRLKEIPVIFNSSISDAFSGTRGAEAGGEGYLVKFDANLFVPEISRVIKSHIKPTTNKQG